MRLGLDFSHDILLEKIFLGAAKQNRFQIARFFYCFSSAYFLDIMSPMFRRFWLVRTPLKNHKN